MPLNKNFQKRITILDECFSSPTGQFTLEKLIEVIGDKLDMSISRKTIQNDISYIKETIENKKKDLALMNTKHTEWKEVLNKVSQSRKVLSESGN